MGVGGCGWVLGVGVTEVGCLEGWTRLLMHVFHNALVPVCHPGTRAGPAEDDPLL